MIRTVVSRQLARTSLQPLWSPNRGMWCLVPADTLHGYTHYRWDDAVNDSWPTKREAIEAKRAIAAARRRNRNELGT